MPRLLLAFLCILFWAAPVPAQLFKPGPQVATFLSDVDDTDQPYGLYLPKDFSPARKYPLVISLHGAGSNHRLNLRRVFGRGNRPGETDAEASRYFPPLRDVEYIVASPLSRGTMGYQSLAEKDVYDVLTDVKKRFPIDEDRIYLTGLSMGGGGTFWLGLTRPDVWAAIAPVCAAVPEGTEDLAPNALNLPVHLFHGDQDQAVPVAVSRKWQKLLLGLNSSVEYIEYPDVRHNSWDYAYRDGAIFDWFAKFRGTPFPDRVRFVSRTYKYNSAYWVQLDGLTPGVLASIDARFTAPNKLEVTTAQLDGFTLNLDGHPKCAKSRPLEISVDGVVHKLKAQAVVSFSKAPGWQPSRYTPAGGAKRPGLEGPISEAVTSRHIYVYGTGNAPDQEELRRRRELAERAAEWSSPRSRLLLSLRVASDKEVSEADLRSANLVLFGTRETNTLIARFAPGFPMELNPGAADYGLLFVAPAGERYVLINAGLPWWTGADQVKRSGFRFIGAPFRLLLGFGDFMLFKGSLENVIAEGRFDRNWKLAAADAAKIQATGAVQIR